jgi:hypothetical protein
MNTVNSRALTLDPRASVYVTSESPESGWGQPPASHYIFTYRGTRLIGELIAGVYLPSSPQDMLIDSRLASEFAAWEAASDQDLSNFESRLS